MSEKSMLIFSNEMIQFFAGKWPGLQNISNWNINNIFKGQNQTITLKITMMYDEPNRYIFTIRLFFILTFLPGSQIYSQIKKQYFSSHIFIVNLLDQPLLPRVCTLPTMKGPEVGLLQATNNCYHCTKASDPKPRKFLYVRGEATCRYRA